MPDDKSTESPDDSALAVMMFGCFFGVMGVAAVVCAFFWVLGSWEK